jgi:hypothetical protein
MPPSPDDDLPDPSMDHTGGYKDSQYTPQMGELIVRRMAEGQTVRQIAADPAMPCYATIYHWRRLHPDFADLWEQVRMLDAWHRVQRWAGSPGRTRPGGKKSSFTVERGEAVCVLLAEGIAMSAINAMPGMPSAKVTYTWLKREPKFREMVGEARREGLRWLALQGEIAWEKGYDLLPVMTSDLFKQLKAERGYFEGRIGLLTPKVYGRFKTG